MQGMVSKLQTVGMLIALVSAIGGGFYTWGTFNQRLDVIEKKKFVVNQTVDLTEIHKSIADLSKEVNKSIENNKADIKINAAALEYLESLINELKVANNNPLLN